MQKTIVIIPCYNEGKRMNTSVFSDFLRNNPAIHLKFVDDGSTDNTFEVISGLSKDHKNCTCIKFDENCGKAEVIRKSVLMQMDKNNCDYIGYFDADLSTPLEYISKFEKVLDTNAGTGMVIGSRIKRLGSTISRNIFRHYSGRIVATIASNLLNLPVYDTQCGAKLFRTKFINGTFNKPFYTKWLFDIEVFARLRQSYSKEELLNSVLEYPLEKWIDYGNSRIKFMDFIKVPINLFTIYIKY